MLVSLCAETINPFSRGTKSDSCGRKCISLSSESWKSNNRLGEGGVLKDVGGLGLIKRGGGRGGSSICAWKLEILSCKSYNQ